MLGTPAGPVPVTIIGYVYQGSICASEGMVSRLITNRRYDATNSCYDTCTPNVIGSYFNALLMLFRSDVTEIR